MANLKSSTIGSTSDTSPSTKVTGNMNFAGGEIKIENGKLINTKTTFNFFSSTYSSINNKVYLFPDASTINLFSNNSLQTFEIRGGKTNKTIEATINNQNTDVTNQRTSKIMFSSHLYSLAYTTFYGTVWLPAFGEKGSIEMIQNSNGTSSGDPFLRFNVYDGSSIVYPLDITYTDTYFYFPFETNTIKISKHLYINHSTTVAADSNTFTTVNSSGADTTRIKGVLKISAITTDYYDYYATGRLQDGAISIFQNSASTGGVALFSHNYADTFWRLYVGTTSSFGSYNKGFFGFGFTRGTSAGSNYSSSKDIVGYVNTDTVLKQMNFTGQHRCAVEERDLENYKDKIGLIVVSTGKYYNLDNKKNTVDESLPVVELSTKRNQKSVFGVVSDSEDTESRERNYNIGAWGCVLDKYDENDNRLHINSVGEGGIWVTNVNGNLENGDYITSSEIPGYGMRQDSEFLYNYTVAKITCDCDFNLESPIYICEEFQWEGQTYRRAFVGCTYHCG